MFGLAWIAIATVLTAPGCAQIPVPRSNSNQVHLPDPNPNHTPLPLVATNQTTEMPERTDESGALPPLPLSMSELDPADAPTPLLDAALAKANAEAEQTGLPELSRNQETEPSESGKDEPASDRQGTQASDQAQTPEPQAGPEPDSKLVALRALSESNTAKKPTLVAINPDKPVKPIDPRELWSEGISRLRRIASEQARASSSGAWTLRAHLLDAIAEEDIKGAGKSEQARPWRMALAALGIPHDSASTATDADQPPRGAEIRAAVVALESEAPLEISDLRLCRKVNGFGNFDPLDTAACKAGQPLIVYCEMSGLQYTAAGEQFHSRLSSRVELVPTSGGDPVWAQSLGSAEDVCRRRRRDYYVNYRIILADTIPPGVYELRVVQKDEIAGHSTSASIPLTIQR
ncbi:hypothetical protein [Singulisphaera acidiphila]|uniref:Uncharacterized protein n=1 Tax=Singulisphaera acidiphila (strain ATCC BAA-1392 / DSM 18658 / VKM B-2454 / MOB10) TaxID=886293 RepID=L0DBZ2_SINAD|nr:hypothetical protein [Singulisphaera acidiphila]AGA26884.1 hypothetical protein Sinac_2582 [Singulisphaera acidiphila DSM 18658]